MVVQDVMTVNVASVGPNATLKQVAATMASRKVSGVPVVNADGRILGVVTERDLIVKGASRGLGLIGRLWTPAAVDDRRLAATTAGDAMTAPPLTIAPDRPLAEAAWLMVERDVNRLPVVLDDRLVGIVSRADLVRAFTRSDTEIFEDLERELGGRGLWQEPAEFDVSGGRVHVSGRVEEPWDVDLVEALVWRIPGVVSVDVSNVESPQARHTANG